MDEASIFPQALRGTIEGFWNLRKEVVHRRVSQHLAIRAIDCGFRILRMLYSITRRSYIVNKSKVLLLSDSEGIALRTDVHGVLLESIGPHGDIEGSRIHPTRKAYVNMQGVSWEGYLRGLGWDETWYLDPVPERSNLPGVDRLDSLGDRWKKSRTAPLAINPAAEVFPLSPARQAAIQNGSRPRLRTSRRKSPL